MRGCRGADLPSLSRELTESVAGPLGNTTVPPVAEGARKYKSREFPSQSHLAWWSGAPQASLRPQRGRGVQEGGVAAPQAAPWSYLPRMLCPVPGSLSSALHSAPILGRRTEVFLDEEKRLRDIRKKAQ
jgi:hypothetical protein